jgi:hypothetical protein
MSTGKYTYLELLRRALERGDDEYLLAKLPTLFDRIERLEELMDDVDAKYSLVDDNSADENHGKVRLFLALDDVRKAWKGD